MLVSPEGIGIMMRDSKKAVVLAGGKGTRLGPYTTILPKPLLPVGDQAILEVVVSQLRRHGFTDMVFAVGYLAHLIQAVFGDGSSRDVSVRYHFEDRPLGTAGAIATIDGLDEPFLLMNGDVLTTLDYEALYNAHVASGNILTIAANPRVVPVDFGVLHMRGEGEMRRVTHYEEKPDLSYTVSMGIYLMDPAVRDFIEADDHLDLPNLVRILIAAGEPVGGFVHDGYWLDIGRHEDYERALTDSDARDVVDAERVNGAGIAAL
jgi:NDP-sugar pyrophosphorylase family protein